MALKFALKSAAAAAKPGVPAPAAPVIPASPLDPPSPVAPAAPVASVDDVAFAKALNRARNSRLRLDEATDKLNSTITTVEKAIAALKLGVSASVRVASDEDGFERYLSFMKINDQWRLASEETHPAKENEYDTVPLANAPRSIRLAATGHFKRLVEAMIKAVDSEITSVTAAVVRAEAFAKSIAEPVDDSPPDMFEQDAVDDAPSGDEDAPLF